MEYCTNSHNGQNNTMGNCSVYALSAEEWQPALFKPCTALPESKRQQCPHSILLNSNVVLLCVRKRQSFTRSLPQHFYGYREWSLADRNITGLRNLHVDLNSAYIPAALHLKDLFVIRTLPQLAVTCRRARARSRSCSKNSYHTCNGHTFCFFAHTTAKAISYLRSFTKKQEARTKLRWSNILLSVFPLIQV